MPVPGEPWSSSIPSIALQRTSYITQECSPLTLLLVLFFIPLGTIFNPLCAASNPRCATSNPLLLDHSLLSVPPCHFAPGHRQGTLAESGLYKTGSYNATDG